MDLGIGGISDVNELKVANGIETYRAHHDRLGRLVAVRLFPAAAKYLLAEEMKTLSSVTQGPGIVHVHNFGTTEHGRPFIITDYHQQSLLDILGERGPMPPFRACAVLAEVADAVFFAHERGVVHGNIRPSTIMFGDRGFLLTDFGSAGAVAFQGETPMPGTAYAAPESLDTREVPQTSSDVYGLGATLFHLVTGQAPFRDQPAAAASRKVPNLRNSSLPDPVCQIIESTMASLPYQRPSVGELRQALQRAARSGGEDVAAAKATNRRSHREIPDQTADDLDLNRRPAPASATPTPPDATKPQVDESPLGPNAVPVRGTAAKVRELRSVSSEKGTSDSSWVTPALAIALFVGVLGLLYFALRSGSSESIVVPNVQGQSESAATATLQDIGLEVSVEFEPSDVTERGLVTRSEPTAGGAVASGASVSVFVSTGDDCTTSLVPNFVGEAAGPAREAVIASGYDPSLIQQPSETVGPGNVISTTPAAGACVPPGSELTLLIACTSTVIPPTDQLSTVEMVAALDAEGLNAISQAVVDDSVEPGTLVDTEPAAGTLVCTGSTVAVNVAASGGCPQLPNVVGQSQDDAFAILDDLGYLVSVRTVNSDLGQSGRVVSSTPAAGTPLCAEGAVTLDVVSGGDVGPTSTAVVPEETASGINVSVPYVFYLDIAEAERILSEAGLVPQIAESESIYADHPFVGTVRSTNPSPQTNVRAGSEVELVVWCAEPCS